mgnify:FL=1
MKRSPVREFGPCVTLSQHSGGRSRDWGLSPGSARSAPAPSAPFFLLFHLVLSLARDPTTITKALRSLANSPAPTLPLVRPVGPPQRMATIHSLAVETLAYIFELAHDPRTTQTMLSASLVCQAWRHPAQHVLCQDVVISIHYSLETSPGGFAAPDFFEYHQRWEAWYLARRTCAPLRVELVSGSGARKVVVTELAWCSGVRHLVLNNVDISASFLTDSHMRGEL